MINKRDMYFHSSVSSPPNVSSIVVNRNYFKSFLNSTPDKTRETKVPDIELVLGISALTGDISGSYRGLLGLSDEFYREVFTGYEGFDAFSIVPILLQPKSRGRVTLKTSDPHHRPIFDINYYDHKDDLRTIVRGIKKVAIFGKFIVVFLSRIDFGLQSIFLLLSSLIQLILD